MEDEWRVCRLGDVVDIFDGPHATPRKIDAGPIFLGISNLANGRLGLTSTAHLSEEDYIRWTRRVTPQEGDVVFSYETRLGEAAIIPAGLKCCLGRRMGLLRTKSSHLDSRFLLYTYLGAEFQETIRSRTVHGSTVDRIPLVEMPDFPIRLPSLKTQQAIACILGTLDDKIELNRRMNETLEGIARAIFKSWFVDFDPVRAKASGEQPPGLAPHIADLFPDAFETSESGEIPRGWMRTSLKRLFPLDSNCVITGPFGSKLHASDYREEGVPLLLVKNVVNGAIVEDGVPLVGWHKVPELERYRLKLGDIVFTRVGAVGRSAYIYPRYVGWMISGQTLRVSISDWDILHPRYLASVFQYPAFIAMVESHALGTTRPSLNTNILKSFEFLYPPPELQLEYARIVAALNERRLANLDQIGTLATLRDTLLPRLISGELRVPDAERIVRRKL
ncbi:MAG: restriction endonuclease subunit S [Candidatus Eisenbacteria sp.]|nr:restriction endonuclease subunit S [Candidatus Eisenbacteria bacterium]